MVKDPIKGAILGTGSGLKAKDIHTLLTDSNFFRLSGDHNGHRVTCQDWISHDESSEVLC